MRKKSKETAISAAINWPGELDRKCDIAFKPPFHMILTVVIYFHELKVIFKVKVSKGQVSKNNIFTK